MDEKKDEVSKFYGQLNYFTDTWGRRFKLVLGAGVLGIGVASLVNRFARAKPKIQALLQGDTALTDAITPSQIKALSSLLGNQNAVTTDLIAAFRFSSELSNLMGLHASKFGNKSTGGKHRRDDHFQDELVGKEIRKQFTGGYFNGRVEHYNSKSKMFHIVYDDGDEEDLEKDDVIRYNQCWKVFQAQQLSKKFLNQQSKKTPYDYEGDFVMNSSNSDDEMKGVRQHLRSGRPVGLPPQDDTGRPMIWDQTEHRWRAAGIKDTKKTVDVDASSSSLTTTLSPLPFTPSTSSKNVLLPSVENKEIQVNESVSSALQVTTSTPSKNVSSTPSDKKKIQVNENENVLSSSPLPIASSSPPIDKKKIQVNENENVLSSSPLPIASSSPPIDNKEIQVNESEDGNHGKLLLTLKKKKYYD